MPDDLSGGKCPPDAPKDPPPPLKKKKKMSQIGKKGDPKKRISKDSPQSTGKGMNNARRILLWKNPIRRPQSAKIQNNELDQHV